MLIYAKTHKGLVRPSNQDSLLVAHNLYGVADGMGGHRGGETASRIAVQVVRNVLQGKTPEENSLRISIEAANRRIFDMQRHELALAGMGTTFTMLWEGRTEMLIGHVGDSRAYLYRDGVLACRTEDHSVVAELVRNHVITPEMAKTHPYRSVITRALGTDPRRRARSFARGKATKRRVAHLLRRPLQHAGGCGDCRNTGRIGRRACGG